VRVDWRDPLGMLSGLRASFVVQNATGFKGYSGTGFSYDSIGYTNIYPVTPRYYYLNVRYDW
jgi:outer membrane receptor protein involved in Fe transport